MLKRFYALALAFALIIPASAWAICNPFVPNTVLTASALNAGIAGPCITSGTITGATISGVTLDSSAIGASVPASVFGTYFKGTGVDANGYSGQYFDYDNTGATSAGFAFKNARGTSIAPTATQTNDYLGHLDFWGFGTSLGLSATINAQALSTFTGASYQSQLNFSTTASATTTPAQVFNMSNGGANALFGVNHVGTFTGTYADGLVADYATGNGRLSVGAADTLTIYTGGIANTQAEQISTTGTTVLGLKYGTTGAGKLAASVTAPTIASGFGTSPSVTTSNGTASFQINVGTGGTASSGVVTMPAATTGWSCVVSPAAAPQAAAIMYSAPTSTTSITITNYTLTTGAALAWTASTVIAVNCVGY